MGLTKGMGTRMGMGIRIGLGKRMRMVSGMGTGMGKGTGYAQAGKGGACRDRSLSSLPCTSAEPLAGGC